MSRNEYSVVGIDAAHQLALDCIPMLPKTGQGFGVDGNAAPLHPSSGDHVAAAQQRLSQSPASVGLAQFRRQKVMQHYGQQSSEGVHVGLAVVQQLLAL